ncbi:MAG: DUF1553 domain-containing protein [Planctomycetaceae bacterium]
MHAVATRAVALGLAIGIFTETWQLPAVGADTSEDAQRREFDTQVARVLAANCLSCHSGKSPRGKLDLSRQQGVAAGGENGKPLVAGNPDESLLWQRVRDGEMPPKKRLKPADKQLLKEWISKGAIWGTSPIDAFRWTTAGRAGYDWWSLLPLRPVKPPPAKADMWSRNGIDHFVARRLAERGLSPPPEAAPRTLIRRLHYDLIGLPPAPEEVERFVKNPTEEAYRKLVDDLLASTHYGERWGRHWLDVARYGESDGFERNAPRKTLWHYRDWVIQALNKDLPYDQFVRMQLAGDVLQPGPDGAAAVGFLVAGVHNTVVGGSQRMKLLARQDELEEIVAAVSQSFLGLTVNCARCHDHKFDPISTTEYYRMISALDGVQHGERSVPRPDIANQLTVAAELVKSLQSQLQLIDSQARKQILADRKNTSKPTPKIDRPQPYATWEFEGNFKDSRGRLHGTAKGQARIVNGSLLLDGNDSYVETVPLQREMTEKTLEAWVILDDLQQRGGGVISLETIGGSRFDAIVFGEREAGHWMAGSDGFRRTQSFNGVTENLAMNEPVHFAIVYDRGGRITGYRNGRAYGQTYSSGFATFGAKQSHILFGLRHAPASGDRLLRGRILRANLYDRALTASAVAAAAGLESHFVSREAILAWLPDKIKQQRSEIQSRLDSAQNTWRGLQARDQSKVYSVVPRTPGVMRVHRRGSVTDYGEEVTPGGVAAVATLKPDFGLTKTANDANRRRKLAEWITAPANPLFPRVIVNRLWHYHFGTGIVDTPSDLGFNGGRPTHPDLIDWLAQQLQQYDYRLKPLHRLIVLSTTYRQGSTAHPQGLARDAGNRYLWRFSPRRIEAEVVRDATLMVAGALNPQPGGPGFEDVTITPNNGTTYYEPIDRPGAALNRRTVYRFTPRGGRSTVLDTFDCPDPSTATPRRSVTTTPLQALSLLNNPFILRMAEAFAQRVQRDTSRDPRQQVRRAWQLALLRAPEAEEERLAVALVEQHGLFTLCRALFNCNEFIIVD